MYRLSGLLLAVSAVVGLIGQSVALMRWQGYYYPTEHLIGDLGLTECVHVRDVFGPRYICSPGHDWFNRGMLLAGALQAVAALMVLFAGGRRNRRGTGETRNTRNTGNTVAGCRWVGVLVGIAGLCLGTVGWYPRDVMGGIHDIAGMLYAVMMWLAMIIAVDATSRATDRRLLPLLHGGYQGWTLTMLLVSIGGFLALFALGPFTNLPGFFERLWLGMLSVWTAALGAALWRKPTWRQHEQRKWQRRSERDAHREEIDDALRKAVETLDNNQSNRADQT